MKKTRLSSIGAWIMHVLATKLNVHVYLINSRPLDGNASLDDLPEGHEIRYLAEDDIDRLAGVEELNLPASWTEPALNRGDVCIGYFDQGALVSYFWCGFNLVPMEAGLFVRVPSNFSYAYKALTVESHRGMRLQQKLTNASDRELVQKGLTYNIEYIAFDNFAQRSASARYGNTTIGTAGYFRLGARAYPFRSSAVKAIGFEFVNPD